MRHDLAPSAFATSGFQALPASPCFHGAEAGACAYLLPAKKASTSFGTGLFRTHRAAEWGSQRRVHPLGIRGTFFAEPAAPPLVPDLFAEQCSAVSTTNVLE